MKNKLYVASALVTLYAAGASDNNVPFSIVMWMLLGAAFLAFSGWCWEDKKEKDSEKEPKSYNHGNYITKDKRCQGGRR